MLTTIRYARPGARSAAGGDAACFLLAVGVVVLNSGRPRAQHIAPSPLTVDLASRPVQSGGGLRRRWPVRLAVAAGLVSVTRTSAAGAALIALFTVAGHRRFAVVAPIAAGCALVPFLKLLVRPDVPVGSPSEIVLGVVFGVAVLAWGMFVRARRQSLRERAGRVEAEQELRVAEARQGERNRIAREMHDVLAHRLSLLSLHAGALELRPDAAPDEVARAAGVVRDSAYQALEDLREGDGVLRPVSPVPTRRRTAAATCPTSLTSSTSRGAPGAGTADWHTDRFPVPGCVGRSATGSAGRLTNARSTPPTPEVAVPVGQPRRRRNRPRSATRTRPRPPSASPAPASASSGPERAARPAYASNTAPPPVHDFRLRVCYLAYPLIAGARSVVALLGRETDQRDRTGAGSPRDDTRSCAALTMVITAAHPPDSGGRGRRRKRISRRRRRLRPDVVLMDSHAHPRRPSATGTACAPDPTTEVISDHFDAESTYLRALLAGASGFLLKHPTRRDPAAITRVAGRRTHPVDAPSPTPHSPILSDHRRAARHKHAHHRAASAHTRSGTRARIAVWARNPTPGGGGVGRAVHERGTGSPHFPHTHQTRSQQTAYPGALSPRRRPHRLTPEAYLARRTLSWARADPIGRPSRPTLTPDSSAGRITIGPSRPTPHLGRAHLRLRRGRGRLWHLSRACASRFTM